MTMNRIEERQMIEEMTRILQDTQDRVTKAKRAADLIRQVGGYRWVGLYDVLPEEIAVIAWSGPGAPTFPRFPRTAGLSGAAVRAGEPVVVQDVSADPRYLTTLGNTRAEAIFPVESPTGAVVGTVDVESERANAFTDDDRALLEACAAALARLWA